MPTNPKPLQLTIPQGASHFAIWHMRTERTRTEAGKMRNTTTYDRCRGEPNADGTVPDVWPMSEFTPAKVLEHWGPGRYRVDFYDTSGERLKGHGHKLEVAEPMPKGPKLAKVRKRPGDATESGEEQPREPEPPPVMGAWDVFAMLRQQEQATVDRMARESEARAQRDQAFMTTMVQMFRGGGGAAQSPESLDLLKRELNLTLEKEMFRLRKDVSTALGNLQPPEEEPEDDDPEDEPKDLEEAGQRIGMAFLRELEERAPGLVNEIIPQFASWLQQRGFHPSPELQARINAMKNGTGRANGG